MRGQILAVLLILAAFGAWLCFRELDLDGINLTRGESENRVTVGRFSGPDPTRRKRDVLFIATFNARALSHDVFSSQRVAETVADIVGRFDIVALQSVFSHDHVASIADVVNSRTQQNFNYVIGRRDGPPAADSVHLAFLYNQDVVQLDREQLYMVHDPDGLLRHDPLVAWFRTLKPSAEECFTFSLVNVQIDADHRENELQLLADVMREVRNDGRNEDDVILLGDLVNTSQVLTGPLGQLDGIDLAVSKTPTNTRATTQSDNLILQHTATDEFTGRSGVFDFMRQFNFSLEQALEISDRMPVWAEFSVYEGGAPGRIASGRTTPAEDNF